MGPAPGCCRAARALPLAFLGQLADPAAGTGRTWWWAWAATRRGPVVLAAWLRGIPTAIQEQNALPGHHQPDARARSCGWCSSPSSEARRFFPGGRCSLVGNPIRAKADGQLPAQPARGARRKFPLLVFGGSLGATRAQHARCWRRCPTWGSCKERMDFVHQTGEDDLERVRPGYAAAGLRGRGGASSSTTCPPPTPGRTSLVSAGPGATTLAELAVCKKAAILVPFPFATDDHQAVNAARAGGGGRRADVPRGGAHRGAAGARSIRRADDGAGAAQADGEAGGLLGRPEAAKELADVCVELMVARSGGRRGQASRPDEPDVRRSVPASSRRATRRRCTSWASAASA